MHICLTSVLRLATLYASSTLAADDPTLAPIGPGNGIACQGTSKACSSDYPRIELLKNYIHALTDYYSVDDSFVIPPNQYFACNNTYCASFKNMDVPTTLGVAKRVIDQLYQHGCRGCGIAPIAPENDNTKGYLAVDVDYHGAVQVNYGLPRPPPTPSA